MFFFSFCFFRKSKAKGTDFSLFDDDDDDDDPISDVFSKSTKKPSIPEPSNAKVGKTNTTIYIHPPILFFPVFL